MAESPKPQINLARGVPQQAYRNRLLQIAAREIYSDVSPEGHGAYDGAAKAVDSDANAWRGDVQVLNFIQEEMQDWGLELDPEQILSGSNGAQDLTSSLLEHFGTEDGARIVSPQLNYDRGLRIANRYMNEKPSESGFPPSEVPIGDSGIDLGAFEDVIRSNLKDSPSVFYLVSPGSNPDGFTVSPENLAMACELTETGDRIIMDAAYLSLYFEEDNRLDLSPLQKYIDDGTLFIVRSATKEGGARGHAYALGDSEILAGVLKTRSDQSLSPVFETPLTNVHYEMAPYYVSKHSDLDEIVANRLDSAMQRANAETAGLIANFRRELDHRGVLTAQEFRSQVIRPGLKQAFENLKAPLVDADIELSNEDVDHGYNVVINLPSHATEDELAKFKMLMHEAGVKSGDLNAFSPRNQLKSFPKDGVPKGFRVPFGGFTPEQCSYIGESIASAYQKAFG